MHGFCGLLASMSGMKPQSTYLHSAVDFGTATGSQSTVAVRPNKTGEEAEKKIGKTRGRLG